MLVNAKYEKFIRDQYDELIRTRYMPHFRVLGSPNSAKAILDGQEILILCANNYLGLANDPEMKKAAVEAVEKWGAGMGTGRMIMTMAIQDELEEKAAEFKSAEAALVYPTGYTANVGAVWSLMAEGDTIVSDELNHASIIDGCRLARGTNRLIYKHLDMKDLEAKLKESVKDRAKGKTMIITDSVFSQDGDICPLPEIVELAEKYDAFVYIDDAHATGVLGKTGRGTVEHFNLYGRVEVQMGTLSKAIATCGGYVAGSNELKYYLWRRSRTYCFSTGFPDPATAGATLKAFEIIKREPERVQRLWDNTRYFKKELEDLGFNTGISQTPITPVIVGTPEKAMQLSRLLYEEEKIFVNAVSYPVVPKGTDRIRTIVNAHHKREELDYAVGAFERVGKKLDLI
ncbi:aminotransferase class I/II-fold pyridoxal phosphate-dependent enzyme [Candidatus Bathyarchaeota archaeon]|nr:aminotransferase class I/II-fold pyridoxal phosphate-dependent enzyme [Candidatus Bathyarchaeota archaeon]